MGAGEYLDAHLLAHGQHPGGPVRRLGQRRHHVAVDDLGRHRLADLRRGDEGGCAGQGAQVFPYSGGRVVQNAAWIGLDLCQQRGIHLEPDCHRFIDHPLEGAVGEPRLHVATPHIRMHAGEPLLLETPVVRPRAVGIPKCGRKARPHLVHAHRMPCVANDGAEFGVVKAVVRGVIQHLIEQNQIVGHPQGANRIPHPDHVDVHLPVRQRAGDEAIGGGPLAFGIRLAIALLIYVGDPLPGLLVGEGGEVQQAAATDEPAQAARRIGPTAEAEQKDAITAHIVPAQPFVGTLDVAAQPRTQPAAKDAVGNATFGAHARVVILELGVV